MNIAAVILAGGLAQRMGGGDKALLEIAGRPLLQHVIERLTPQVAEIAINANGDLSRFAAFDLPVIPDTVEGFVGPLGGVLAGMRLGSGAGALAYCQCGGRHTVLSRESRRWAPRQ